MASVKLDRNAAYLQLLGYSGFGADEANDVSAGLAQYRAQNGIPAATRTENVIRQMREEIASDPDVVARMQRLADGGPNPYHEGVVQLGLRALGQPGAVDGELKESDRAQLQNLKGKAAVQPQAQFNQAAHSDPKVGLSQAYLRVLGYTGGEKNDVGRIDGVFGPKTTAAMAQFANTNKINPDDPQLVETTQAALKAQAMTPENLKRMEDLLNAADPTKPNQDVRAIQTILKDAGLNVDVDGRAGPQTMAALHMQQVKTPEAPTPEDRLQQLRLLDPVERLGIDPRWDRENRRMISIPEVPLKPADGPQERIEIAPGQAVPIGVQPTAESTVTELSVEQPAAPVATAPVPQPAAPEADSPAPAEKPWFAGQNVTDRGKTYTEGGQYEAARSDRGAYTAPFNNAATSGYPYAAPSPAAAALKGLGLETALGNKGGFLGTGINFQVNSRGQYGVQVPGANIYKR